jgi:hypothetical protein
MTQNEIKDIQRKLGVTVDGYWGSESNAACVKHMNALVKASGFVFPKAYSSAFNTLWGPHGVPNGYTPPMKKIKLPFKLYLYGDKSSPVTTLSPHEKAADAFTKAFEELAKVYTTEEARDKAGINIYDGLYNPRLVRGSSSTWSMHSFAIAIDLDASRNGLHTYWPTKAHMPFEAIECFAKAGMRNLGYVMNRDSMHAECSGIS